MYFTWFYLVSSDNYYGVKVKVTNHRGHGDVVYPVNIASVKFLFKSISQFPITGLQLNTTPGCLSCNLCKNFEKVQLNSSRFPVFPDVVDILLQLRIVDPNVYSLESTVITHVDGGVVFSVPSVCMYVCLFILTDKSTVDILTKLGWDLPLGDPCISISTLYGTSKRHSNGPLVIGRLAVDG